MEDKIDRIEVARLVGELFMQPDELEANGLSEDYNKPLLIIRERLDL